MKKKIGLLLTALCSLAVLPMPCKAAGTYSYTVLEDGTASVFCEDASIIHAEIPSEIDGYTVSELAEGCFSDCISLETVVIPNSVTTLQSYVFQNCVLLEEVEIPASVEKIDEFVFEGCTSLVEIRVDADNQYYFDTDGILFKNEASTVLMRYPAAKQGEAYTTPANCGTLAPWSFTDCRYLKTLDVSSAEAIGADAFMGMSELRSCVLPQSSKELIGAAFAYCAKLTSVTLPENLETIGDRCFFGCAELRDLEIPDSLKSVGEMAFYGCVSLTKMQLPSSLNSIGEYGIGYSVNQSGEPTLIPDLKLEVDFGSPAYSYAREKGISYHTEPPKALLILILVAVLMIVLLAFGIRTEMLRRKKEKLAEEERLQEERRAKFLAERNARKKKKDK